MVDGTYVNSSVEAISGEADTAAVAELANQMVMNFLYESSSWLAQSTGPFLWKGFRFLFLRLPSSLLVYLINGTVPFYLVVLGSVFTPIIVYLILRSRVLSAYSRLKGDNEDEVIDKKKQLVNDSEAMLMGGPDGKRRSGFSSYLDEFLSAIKIFGYLDKLVFHELTKSMRTQRLEQGEVMLLDDSVGFAIVVEGGLHIYHKIAHSQGSTRESMPLPEDRSFDSNEDDLTINGERFQLLNKVKAGNPVSSLVSILKLFTDNHTPTVVDSSKSSPKQSAQVPIRQLISPFLDGNVERNKATLNMKQVPTAEYEIPSAERAGSNVSSFTQQLYESMLPKDHAAEDVREPLPEIVAYAASDCAIAVIPASSFKRLMVKYPRSASQIIQVILTKLYRVTFQTAHSYLGLTKEIMHTEVVLNNSTNFELPYYLQEAILRKIKNGSKESSVQESIHRATLRSKNVHAHNSPTPNKISRHIALESRDQYNPGDLLSNVPLSRKGSKTASSSSVSIPRISSLRHQKEAASSPLATLRRLEGNDSQNFAPLSSSSPMSVSEKPSVVGGGAHDNISQISFSSALEETEESSWRMALVESMFGYLGITNESIMPPTEDLLFLNNRASSGSSVCSVSSYSHPQTINQDLFRCLSPELVRTKKKAPRQKYTEEMPINVDFNTAKEEFAEGLETLFIPSGATIVEQNGNNKGLYYIVSGELLVCWKNEEDNIEYVLYTVKPGGIAGYLASLIGFKSFVSLRAKTDLYVGFLPIEVLERLCDKYFMIYLKIAETLTKLLSPKILKLDYALEWIHLEASETLFNQNDPANAIYVVLNGRLRQLHQKSKNEERLSRPTTQRKKRKDDNQPNVQVVGEYSQGCSFGEVEVLTAMNRVSTVVAVRDTELARIPRTLFEVLALEHPSIMIRVSRLVAHKILQRSSDIREPTKIVNSANGYRYDFNLTIPPSAGTSSWGNNSDGGSISYKTITILPITYGLPVEEFANKLVSTFRQVGRSTIGLTQCTTLKHLGRHAFDKLANLKQSGYFAELEELYELVVYIADTPVKSSWTSTCISQGDCILLLADASSDPEIGEFERLLINNRTTARTELLLLHPERYVEPGLTHKWLRKRTWVHQHHHMQFVSSQNPSERVDSKAPPIPGAPPNLIGRLKKRERLNQLTKRTQENFARLLPDSIKLTVENISMKYIQKKQKYYTPVSAHKNDFLRLARILSGQAIGLVLGGGGARGISHLGILKAIEEHGIPIDMIGGTSIGSFVGGLYAKDYDLVPTYGRVKKFAGRIGSIWRMLSDLTWPVTSYTTGHEFNRGIWKAFGDIRIEDFWIQYYCNSTNITESMQEIHTFGYAWRYVRASMSLAGILPPITDNGNMLLDGGYLDNLPVLEMKARGCKTIFAVDVGSVDDRTPMDYGDSLNGFWIVLNRWNPFSKHPNVPSMAEIQMRLGYVASVNALEKAKTTQGVVYFRPPIEDYATLDFAKFEEIYQVGTAYGATFLHELEQNGKLPRIPGNEPANGPGIHLLHRRNSI
ncbi:AER124Wp [Eremothecium gossypii ATCC 10895]|uniref:Lysophospholipase NTE1 n=1 Tax=Eremothecium gossypii (strain ATCC 10895 / CBS 109.51 / FGSC 9923 / NRRL Y-1056) TaxID=284811 RepID=NTE1_EREGS|nr:AER124Wp [Eremothecium gossypii ATCC 10895]Q756Z0.1 RecName: Full=Lysophospholipase NTE1; AltName: Full=Intracellular phospholipase B; AltName: Full=Neuropathy target esterase homolog [Eremothecium gossypii ATCC 10895]AAS52807.1 AER124Wp [Eremothecium gossypii ATCC 10895]AEY97113.1 FAER124Wp [Eremothecium gossypii FDAG1]